MSQFFGQLCHFCPTSSSPIPSDEMLKNEEIGSKRYHLMRSVNKLHTGDPLQGYLRGSGMREIPTGLIGWYGVHPISSFFDISSNQVQLTGVDSKWHN